ncbi:MAG: hypothetical protein HYY24_17580 [Verrucomicrobia bacterium]|nr:hypothetical protein [Verrucomicrobiota bacterium]
MIRINQILCSLAAASVSALGANPLEVWHARLPEPVRWPLNSVAFGDGTYVAVGEGGSVLTSADAFHWDFAYPVAVDFSSITFANGLFVAVAGPRIFTSPDDYAWSERSSDTSQPLSSVTYGGGKFVAVGGESLATVSTSADGTTWSAQSLGVARRLRSVAFGNGRFVAVGESDALCTSADGLAWTPAGSGASGFSFQSPPSFFGVSYGNGRFVVVGAGSYRLIGAVLLSLISVDGTNWQASLLPYEGSLPGQPGSFSAVAFGENRFVATMGSCGMPGMIRPWSSVDGVSWQPSVTPLPFSPMGFVSYVGAKFLAGGGDETATCPSCEPMWLIASADGSSWTNSLRPRVETLLDLQAAAYGKGRFVVAGAPKAGVAPPVPFLTSTDGANWLPVDWTITEPVSRLMYVEDRFVGVAGTSILTSPDGLTWSQQEHVSSAPLEGLDFDRIYVAVGEQGTILTADAAFGQWQSRSSGTVKNLHSVAHGNSHFVAVGDTGTVAISQGGVEWDSFGLGIPEALRDIAFGNGLFVVAGDGGILSSPDGFDWSIRQTGTWSGVTFSRGLFVAANSEGLIAHSADGTDWVVNPIQPELPPFISGPALRRVFWAADTFLVVGDSAALLQSDPWNVEPPKILQQPVQQNVLAGGSGTFSVEAQGVAPLRYRWRKNGIDVPGATDRIHTLTQVQPGDGGLYTVVVSDGYGSVTSVPAALIVGARAVLAVSPDPASALLLHGLVERNYRVEYADELHGPGTVWRPLTTFPLAVSPSPVTDPTATDAATRFYRAVAVP